MLKEDVGINAGIIWDLLSEKGRLSIREIGELTHYKDSLLLLSLGWLSRENKITITDAGGYIYVELNVVATETYY